MLIGTPAYMSPEQVDGEPDRVGPPSDQFSLGVILFELCTGQLPFRGSLTAVMAQILTKETTPPSQLRPGLDGRIDAVCLKMMAKTPAERFTSLSAVSEELASILRNPAQGSRLALGPRPARVRRRAPPLPASKPPRRGSHRPVPAKPPASRPRMSSPSRNWRKNVLLRHDYDQVIQIVERVPEEKRTAGLTALLEKSRTKADEIAFLVCEIDEAVRFHDRATVLKKSAELLKIKPGHHRALEVQEQFAGSGKGAWGAARLAPLVQYTQPWREGGWIPWSVFAFGLGVCGVMTALVVLWLGKTAVIIDAENAGITIAVNGQTALITVPGEQSIKVSPGEQTLDISYAGLETTTKKFQVKYGGTPRLKVWIANKELIAHLEGGNL